MADISFKADLLLSADKAKKDVEAVSKEVDKVQKSAKKAGDTTRKGFGGAISDAASGLQQMGIAGTGAFGKVASAIGMGSKAAQGFKVALAATGIGLIIVAVSALVAGFTRLQDNNDKLTRKLAGLKAIFDVIMDAIGFLATAIVDAFTNPQEAIESITQGVQEYYNWLKALGQLIITSIVITFEKMRLGILRAAAATKEFFGADATELRQQIAETEAEIRELQAAAVETAKAVVQPFVDMAEAVSNFREELGKAQDAAESLRAREIALEKQQIKAIETQAKRNKEIARLRLLYEEEGRSLEEREAALRSALDLEQQNLDERLAMAREEARIITEKNAISESSRDDLKREAEAKARVLQLEEQSFSRQKEITAQLRGLAAQRQALIDKEAAAELKAHEDRMAALDEINNKLTERFATAETKETEAAIEKYEKLLDLAEDNAEVQAQIEEAMQLELQDIRDKYRQAELDAQHQARKDEADARRTQAEQEFAMREELEDAKFMLANSALNAIESLSNLAFANDEARARKAFNVMKALRVGEAAASTFSAANSVLADPTIPTLLKPKIVAATILQGVSNTAKIAAQKFGGGAGSVGSSGASTSFDVGSQSQTPNITALQQGAQEQSIQAYVIEQNVSSSQQANQRIKEVSAL